MLAQGRILRNVLVANMDKQMEDISMERYQKKVCELEVEEVYIVLVCLVKRLLDTFIRPVGEKTLYYISSRFEKRKFFPLPLKEKLLGVRVFLLRGKPF